MINSCPVCTSTDLLAALDLPAVPVFANNLWTERDLAVRAPRGPMRLAYCRRCGHLFNQAFRPEDMDYDLAYENSLHFSPRFNEYAEWLADTLIERYDLREKQVIEIGSGKGEFLTLLCERSGSQGTGYDPSYTPPPGEEGPVRFVQEAYSPAHAAQPADLILSRHTLEHLADPAGFARTLHQAVLAGSRAPVFCEVPNAGYLVRQASVWDVIYEHFSVFSASSLETLFGLAGFRCLRVMEPYDGQFLTIEAAVDGDRAAFAPPPPSLSEADVRAFTEQAEAKIEQWRARLSAWQAAGRRVVVWGAGSKGIMFLNLIDPQASQVAAVVDLNPRKTGKYVVGAGHVISLPTTVAALKPDVILVMNPIYREEIGRTARELGMRAELVVV